MIRGREGDPPATTRRGTRSVAASPADTSENELSGWTVAAACRVDLQGGRRRLGRHAAGEAATPPGRHCQVNLEVYSSPRVGHFSRGDATPLRACRLGPAAREGPSQVSCARRLRGLGRHAPATGGARSASRGRLALIPVSMTSGGGHPTSVGPCPGVWCGCSRRRSDAAKGSAQSRHW